ncbi:hypothetical protein EHS25_010140 [Saitozyma podzolica]|uniref:Uncharacterized protein n=1 Tax=Saitozyma podzolica TaxID=1890683 RepID=A0A427YIP4_9TREE|nr:hypothetical protein EHS25_010140 [Saitozyma podzolica]
MSSQAFPSSAPSSIISAEQFIKSHCSHELRLQRSPPHLPDAPMSSKTTDLRAQFTKCYPNGLEITITRSLDLAQETVQATDDLFSSVSTPGDLEAYVNLVANAYQYSSTGNEVPELHGDYKYALELAANWLLDERMKSLHGADREVWEEIAGEEGASVKDSKQRTVAMEGMGRWAGAESGATPISGPRKDLKRAFRPIAEMIRRRLVGKKVQTGQDRTSISGPSDRLLAIGPRVILLLAELKLPSSLTGDRVGKLGPEGNFDLWTFMQIALEFQRYEQFEGRPAALGDDTPIARLQAKNLTSPLLPTPLALLTALPAKLIQDVLDSHKKGKKRERK